MKDKLVRNDDFKTSRAIDVAKPMILMYTQLAARNNYSNNVV